MSQLPTHARACEFLESLAKLRHPVIYHELAKALRDPTTAFHQRVTQAPELLMQEDAAGHRPSRRSSLATRVAAGPARGLFDFAQVSAGSRAIRTHGRFTLCEFQVKSFV